MKGTSEKSFARMLLEAMGIPLAFWALAIWLGVTTHPGYIFNFGYIGTSIGIGSVLEVLLPKRRKIVGRRVVQFLVGGYMLGLLGFYGAENMQLEGFFFNLLAGVTGGAVLHYMIAKLFGPFWFGRGWCSAACWTAGVLDLLPFGPERRQELRRVARREKRSPGAAAAALPAVDPAWTRLRYVMFASSLGLVLVLYFGFGYRPADGGSALTWLVAGNVLYYGLGIGLAFALKDNRAFCKYLCPVSVPLRVGARFSLLKVTPTGGCSGCGACSKACTMEVDPCSYVSKGERVLSSECVQCQACVHACPQDALAVRHGLDVRVRSHRPAPAGARAGLGLSGRLRTSADERRSRERRGTSEPHPAHEAPRPRGWKADRRAPSAG